MQEDVLEKINGIIKSGKGYPSTEDIAQLESTYPFFTVPSILRLTRGIDVSEEERRRLSLKVALSSGDRTTIFRLTDSLGNKLATFYPPEEMAEATTTEDALNTFIEEYSNIDDKDTAQLEQMIFNPIPYEDYADMLEQEDDVASKGQDAVFDAFLKEFAPGGVSNKNGCGPKLPPDDDPYESQLRITPLSEEQIKQKQAKIAISKGDYNRAYEIIRQLSLKYPEKSVYFADQLRFLEKLIQISKYKK